jgi:hypothetical protein
MRPIVATKALATSSATNIAAAQAVAAAGNLTLNGTTVTAGVATLDTQRRIGITSAADDSGITFTVYGTMQGGKVISEVVTGAAIGVASTLQDFLTVTRVAASGAAAGNVSVGTTAVGSTPWFLMDVWQTPFEVGLGFVVNSGSVTCTAEQADDDPMPLLYIYNVGFNQTQPVPQPYGINGMVGMTTPTEGSITVPRRAVRLTVTAGTGTGQLTINQAGPTT